MPNLIGSMNLDGTLKGIISGGSKITGQLSNATLRGIPVELRIDETVLQWKYLDSDTWTDLIDLNDLDYEQFENLPQINDVILTGNKTSEDLNLASRNEGITSITRNGTTFTVTRPDGTTFTFDQQDNDTTYEEATESNSGLMSSEDKTKLDNIQVGSQANIIESISINGVAQTINQKNVDIAVPLVDDTLTNVGQAADAKATGDALDSMVNNIKRVADAIPTNVSKLNNDSNYTNKNYVDTELAKKQDALPFGVPTSEDIGKALMPKTVENGVITEWEFGEAGMVDDVRIDGTSVVQNKIANIPIANSLYPGVVKVGSGFGIKLNRNNNCIEVEPATDSDIKNGIGYEPIVPSNQDKSIFYGLASAARDTTQRESDNAVGTYTDSAKSAIKSMLGVEDPIDVQINGKSIVDNGVANVPLASTDDYGVVNVSAGTYGLVSSSGNLRTVTANDSDVKNGTNYYKPVTPYNQHRSAFYGLAKAAGDTTQSQSSNAVGQYTDGAKSAIKTMLGFATQSDITDAISQITQIEFAVVQSLPATGTTGTIYLVQHQHGDSDIYDEYIWIASSSSYEKIGSTDIDLTNYLQKTTVVSESDIDDIVAQVYVPAIGEEAVYLNKERLSYFWGEAKDYVDTKVATKVSDVQINAESVVNNGVANIPIASTDVFGVTAIGDGLQKSSKNKIMVNKASSSQIKDGLSAYYPIVPEKQHESVFYGLAKVAGDATQSASSNAVGTYTDEAKTAIKSMLGVPSENDVVTDVTIGGVSVVNNGVAELPNISYPTAISVTTPPTKTEYEIGNSFDKTGMVVTLIWSTGETRVLADNEYTVSPALFNTTGTQNVTITYRGTEPYVLTATQEVSVVNIIPDTWAKMVQVSRAGVAQDFFKVGDVINDTYTIGNTEYPNPWIVADFQTVELEDGTTYDNVPILIMEYLPHDTVVFDVPEQIEATEGTAIAGRYYFGYVAEGTVYTALNLSVGDTIPYSNYDKVFVTLWNSVNAIRYGCSAWKYSCARQYLNNSGTGWWQAQHECDVMPSGYDTKLGFESYISSDLVSAIHPIKITTKEANYMGNKIDETYDKFWMISHNEMNIKNNNISTVDGEPLQYYKELLESEEPVASGTYEVLKKYLVNNTTFAQWYWVRSAWLGDTSAGLVSNTGYVTTTTPRNAYRLAVACAIV